MKKGIKKGFTTLFVVTVIVSMASFMYSCSNNEIEATHESTITAVSESDEFLDFVSSSDLAAKKFLAYTKTLNQAEFDELMYNLNNDEYMAEVITKAKIENELQLVVKNKNNLLNKTFYLKLDVSDQSNLFMTYANEVKRADIKTRREGGNTNECDDRRSTDYSWAQAKASLALIGCTCLVEIPIAACFCYAAALANYADDIRLADRAYDDCIKSIR